jgi:hypothetical protein
MWDHHGKNAYSAYITFQGLHDISRAIVVAHIVLQEPPSPLVIIDIQMQMQKYLSVILGITCF